MHLIKAPLLSGIIACGGLAYTKYTTTSQNSGESCMLLNKPLYQA